MHSSPWQATGYSAKIFIKNDILEILLPSALKGRYFKRLSEFIDNNRE